MKKKILLISGIFVLLFFSLFFFVFFYAGLYEFLPSTREFPINIQTKDDEIEAEGIKLHYRTLGEEGQQPVVFIHGWGGPYENNDQVTTALHEEGFQVFTIEIPGLDRSTTPNLAWSNDDYAKFFNAVFQKLKIEKPILIGQSFGGGIAASYASQFPENLKYLVLVDSNTTDKDNFYPKMVRLLGDAFSSTMQSNWLPNSVKNAFIKLMLSVPQGQVNESTYAQRAVMGETFIKTHTENQFEKLKSISVPTILIWGESDKKVTLDQARKMLEKLQKSTLSTLPGGHTVIYKDPDAVAKLIKTEISKLDGQIND